MVRFVLKNTLSDNGGVTRGVCHVREDGYLTDITETSNIEKDGERAVIRTDKEVIELDANLPVSMNMWGLTVDFFDVLKTGFSDFLDNVAEEDLKAEYLLPTIIGGLLAEEKLEVKVLKSYEQWFGVTYKEDKETVVNAVRELIEKGAYPSRLFAE